MKSAKLFAVVAVVCITSGCSQNRWALRDSPSHTYCSPTSPDDSASVAVPATGDISAIQHASDFPVDDQAHNISLVSAIGAPTDQDVESRRETGTEFSVSAQTLKVTPAEAGMSLSDFESLAWSNNPSIQELAATTQKAAGFRTQVSLRPNPVFGYQGQQLADQQTDQHLAFIEQEFVTGGKLELNGRVLNEAVRAQLLELQAQKLRVSTDIRVKFYEALAAQRRIQLISGFQSVTDKGVEMAKLRDKVAEGSRIDVLQATVQKNKIDLVLQQAEVQFAAAWRGLVALTGMPHLELTTLVGELPQEMEARDWDVLNQTIVNSSPEYHAARTRVAQARAQLQRQGVQAIPNLLVQFAAGVDNSTNSGMMNVQVEAPIPLFNKNQGNICAAQAEFCRATLDVKRIQKSIESRLADASREYDTSLAAVNKYVQEILPNAAESLKLAELAYDAGETSFVQVLVARRTYFDSNLQFIVAQSQLAQANSKVDGYVLTGSLDPVVDLSGDDSLRGHTFSQQ